MPFSSMRARLRPRPITQYAVALFFVLVAALSMLAALVFHDTARLKQQIAESDERLARQELGEAIALLAQEAASSAQALMQWDEARSMLKQRSSQSKDEAKADRASEMPQSHFLPI